MRTENVKLLIIMVASMCFLSVHGAEESVIKWGENAISAILNRDELAKNGEIFPEWNIKQITWPSVTELSSKSAKVDEKLKLSCIEWLQKFINKDQLPVDVDKNLIAMKGWGLIMKQTEQKRLCDVFIARFKRLSYVVHIQESPYNVVITVVDERLAKTARADHQKLVIETSTSFLNKTLKPDPNSENFHEHVSEGSSDGQNITSVTWAIDSLITIDSADRKALNLSKAGEIGTTHVNAVTNGRFVKFEIIKCPGAVKAAFFDPYVERFSAPR